MGFYLGNIYIDRALYAVITDTKDNVLAVADQVSNFAIDITAESKEINDARGRLLQKIYTAKAGTFTLTSQLLHVPTLAIANGEDVIVAGDSDKIEIPYFKKYASTETDITLDGVVDGSVTVYQYLGNGAVGKSYTLGTSASTTQFVVSEDGKLTLPTDTESTEYFVKCRRQIASGILVNNKSGKFPKTVKVYVLALCGDPCSETRKPLYIECPSVQPSPETSFDLQSDSTFEFKGDLQTNYCGGGDGVLYSLAVPNEEMEDED